MEPKSTNKVIWHKISDGMPAHEGGMQLLAYHLYAGVVVIARAEYLKNRFYTHWAEIPAEGWINTAAEKPMLIDADISSCVLGQRADGIYAPVHISRARDAEKVIRWRPMPAKPRMEE